MQLSTSELAGMAAEAVSALKADARAELLGSRYSELQQAGGAAATPPVALAAAQSLFRLAAEAEVRAYECP